MSNIFNMIKNGTVYGNDEAKIVHCTNGTLIIYPKTINLYLQDYKYYIDKFIMSTDRGETVEPNYKRGNPFYVEDGIQYIFNGCNVRKFIFLREVRDWYDDDCIDSMTIKLNDNAIARVKEALNA